MSNEDFAALVEREVREIWEGLKPVQALSPTIQKATRRLLDLYQKARIVQQTVADLPTIPIKKDGHKTANVNPLQQPPMKPRNQIPTEDERDRLLRETRQALQPLVRKMVEWETNGNLDVVDVTSDELTECDIITGPPENLSSKVKKYP